MNVERLLLYLFAAGLFVASGCSKDDISEGSDLSLLPKLTDPEKINKFIVDCTQDVYLWEALTDWKKYNNYDTYQAYSGKKELHYELFDTLLYEDDRWSFLTEDVDGFQSSLQGISTTYGYTLILGKFTNTDNYFAIILYIYPGAPAEKAGLKRGDLIIGINGGDITAANYTDLYNSSSLSLRLGYVNTSGSISLQPGSIEMEAVEMYENPINTVRIIEKKGHKIGYLCYTDYIDTSERELLDVFAGFKAEGVTDVVLDLRYNSGGHAVTAKFLSSILAPRAVVKNKEIYLTQRWNDLYDQYWKESDRNNNEYFVDTLSVNMDLNRVYVLTTGNTASASEATIIGLKPYMDVVLVGKTTHGKYYGGYVLAIDDYYKSASGYNDNREQYLNISNWGMYIMVYRYANKNNYPDFSGGLAPEQDLAVEEDYFALKPFGDENDPLLGKALEKITGEKYVASPSLASRRLPSYTISPDMDDKHIARKNLIHKPPLPTSRFK
jgi:C-terminal processing protease CtpA/Prc